AAEVFDSPPGTVETFFSPAAGCAGPFFEPSDFASDFAVSVLPPAVVAAPLAASAFAGVVPESALGVSFWPDSAFAGSGLAVMFATIASENFMPRATSTGATTIANTPAMALTIMLLLSAGFSSLSSLPIAAPLARKETVHARGQRGTFTSTKTLERD